MPKQIATMSYQEIFGDQWLSKSRSTDDSPSWADAVMETLSTSGECYLTTLRRWYCEFPAKEKDKQVLRTRLECFRNHEHLGAVNELAWWAFMQHEGVGVVVVPTAKTSRPDFYLLPPVDCFVEVSTLNISENDRKSLEEGVPVRLDHAETIWRLVGKLTDEKRKQLAYATSQKRPCVLVIFDYTEWSAFGTSVFASLGKFLFEPEPGFKMLPVDLSAIVYLERKVLDGRIAFSRDRSAVYFNPLASYPLSPGSFLFLKHFRRPCSSSEPESSESWIWL